MNLKSTMLPLVIAVLNPCVIHADQVWHAIISGSEKVPVDNIEYIISRPATHSLDIVLNDGQTIYEGVPSLAFEYSERAGLNFVQSDAEVILGPYDDVITIKGLAQGSPITVYNQVGQLIDSFTSPGKQEAIEIDLSGYQTGVYIIKTNNSTVKFVKR